MKVRWANLYGNYLWNPLRRVLWRAIIITFVTRALRPQTKTPPTPDNKGRRSEEEDEKKKKERKRKKKKKKGSDSVLVKGRKL